MFKTKKFIALTLLLVFCSTTILSVRAAEIYKDQTGRGYVGVNTTAVNDFSPDTAQVNIYVESSGKNLASVTEENKKTAQKVLDAVKKDLNAQKDEGVKTLAFNVSSEFSYKNNVKTFENYKVTNSIEITVKDTAKLGKVIDTALSAGATRVDGVRFSLSSTDEACNQLISQAVGDAKRQSVNVAKALGMKLGEIKQTSVTCYADGGYVPYYRASYDAVAKGALNAVSESVPTEAGTIKVRASIDAQFYLTR